MKTIIPFPAIARTLEQGAGIQEQAAMWIARLDGGNLDAKGREELRVWLKQDSSHQSALEQMAQVWGAMDSLAILAELFPDKVDPPRQTWRRPWKGWIVPLAACAATVVVAAGLYLHGVFGDFEGATREASAVAASNELIYQTDLGQQSVVTLQDGSILTLNTQSEVHVRFDHAVRNVYLSRGEAHFKVAKNPDRPFVVHAGNGWVRAVGTAFDVRVMGEQVEVLVEEGVVEVVPSPTPTPKGRVAPTSRPVAAASSSRNVVLSSGGTAKYAEQVTQMETLPDHRIEQRLAWRKGKWIFQGETLAEVLDEVARYSDLNIIIVDPKLASLRVGGYFDIGDVDSLMKALETGFGVTVNRDGKTIRLRRDVPIKLHDKSSKQG